MSRPVLPAPAPSVGLAVVVLAAAAFAGCGVEPSGNGREERGTKRDSEERSQRARAKAKARGKGAGRKEKGERAPAIPAEAKRTRVESVTDGDTVELAGLGPSRLIGVDTPEVYSGSECFGEEASAYTADRLSPGSSVFFVHGAERTDRYGRDLVYVWLPGGTFFNAELVKEGFATPLSIAPNVRFADVFDELARRAREAARGLWRVCGGSDTPAGGSSGGSSSSTGGGGSGGGSGGSGGCERGYDPCVPGYPPDVDCADVDGPISVSGRDPHRLDADGDGMACE